MVNIGTPRKLSKSLIDCCEQGVLSVHPGYLPKYRGCSAVEHAILNGDTIFNTAFFMSEEYDAGPILMKESCYFNKKYTYFEFRTAIHKSGISLICKAINLIDKENINYRNLPKQKIKASLNKPVNISVVLDFLDKNK